MSPSLAPPLLWGMGLCQASPERALKGARPPRLPAPHLLHCPIALDGVGELGFQTVQRETLLLQREGGFNGVRLRPGPAQPPPSARPPPQGQARPHLLDHPSAGASSPADASRSPRTQRQHVQGASPASSQPPGTAASTPGPQLKASAPTARGHTGGAARPLTPGPRRPNTPQAAAQHSAGTAATKPGPHPRPVLPAPRPSGTTPGTELALRHAANARASEPAPEPGTATLLAVSIAGPQGAPPGRCQPQPPSLARRHGHRCGHTSPRAPGPGHRHGPWSAPALAPPVLSRGPWPFPRP